MTRHKFSTSSPDFAHIFCPRLVNFAIVATVTLIFVVLYRLVFLLRPSSLCSFCSVRRERNRMHAKMTRDRKKNFIATIEKTIDELESNNARMREVLSKIGTNAKPPTPASTREEMENRAPSAFASASAPVLSPPSMSSPSLSSVVSHDDGLPALSLNRLPSLSMSSPSQQRQTKEDISPVPTKRVRHGFSLSTTY